MSGASAMAPSAAVAARIVEDCFHCHEPLPAGPPILARSRGSERPVCCIGCQAAAEWIESLGLADYYRLRQQPAPRSDSEATDFSVWDRSELARLHVRQHAPDRAEVVVLVDGVRCAACSWLIERALTGLPGLHEVGVNVAARRVRLLFDPQQVLLSELLLGLSKLGYNPHPLSAEGLDSLRQHESRDALKRLVVAGLGAMQAMMYAVALYAGVFDGIDPAVRDFFRWLGVLVATPVVFYSARPFFAGALREWRSRRLSMDTPVALAIGLIYVASVVETLRGGVEIYFDSVSMFVLFLLSGRYIEMRARHRAGDVVDALARLQPALAERLHDAGSETIGVHELLRGDRVRVAAGAAIPADGVLLSAECRIDESLLSGEAHPRLRQRGENLIAGSLLLDGPIEMDVQSVGADTALAGIVRMVTRAASERPQLARLADARAARFVLRVLGLTALTASIWMWFDPARAFSAALAVLVVSCPCAFALAVPSALTRAVAVLARQGVLVTDADALEVLARTDHFVFDKTGTLTEPHLSPANVQALRGTSAEALAIAAALEHGNTHPLALAVRRAAEGLSVPLATQVRHVAGAGVQGDIDGRHYRLGRASFSLPGSAQDIDALVLADDTGEIARLALTERPRGEVLEVLSALAADGASSEILSGDSSSRVAELAKTLGVARWQANATPAAKLARLQELRATGHVIGMVGDGVNDAPVLAGADVAIAIGDGAALAQAASGILLAGDHLHGIVTARQVAQRMLRVLRQNLTWALAYNLSVVPLAALGFVPPWLAAIGMSASSVVVILNSLRIRGDDLPSPLPPTLREAHA